MKRRYALSVVAQAFGGPIPNTISVDYSAWVNYSSTHIVMCFLYYNNVSGMVSQLALCEDYETFLYSFALERALYNATTNIRVYESATQALTLFPGSNSTVTNNGFTTNANILTRCPTAFCYCTTNNCNTNLDTCGAGLNYAVSFLSANNCLPIINMTAVASTTAALVINANSTAAASNTGANVTSARNTTRAITLNGTHSATNATTTVPVITIAPHVSNTSNDTAKRCFSGDSQIKIADGAYKYIAQLQSSDRLAGTTDSDFVLMLDSDPNKKNEEKVISIVQEVKVGYYAPLSGSGE
ncbi:unnamed protein product [Didymodactylos carnosus]|uniref:Uncharacterized protein n=1 Tax=Didymodactylos carnosus TaxID=1234261 RepID=A0A8S2QZW9_9BILA|nr:unnamed protein product [Didymodactylos carnosus]CAF4123465.1 unnamed protein product [Didymodactylos carnosus]